MSAPATHSRVKVRPATFSDYEQITQLEARHGLAPRSFAYWAQLWKGNPAYRELQGDWTIGWVAEDAHQQVVASVANIPLWYELNGKRILANTGKALVAEPSHRSTSFLLLDRLINNTPADLYVNNTANPSSAPLVELFDCVRVPVGAWDRAGFWITRRKNFFEGYLSLKEKHAKLLCYPLAAGACIWDNLRGRTLNTTDVGVVACESFDNRFDRFWCELRMKRAQQLLAVRTREVLKWHFHHAAVENRLWIAGIFDGGCLTAYAVFERRDTGHSGLKRVRLADFQSLDGSTAELSPLLAWAWKRCRDEGVDVLEIVGSWLETGEFIESQAPYRRKLSAWLYYYRARTLELAQVLRDRRAWAPSLFDGDATI
jgi:hypothetical protein